MSDEATSIDLRTLDTTYGIATKTNLPEYPVVIVPDGMLVRIPLEGETISLLMQTETEKRPDVFVGEEYPFRVDKYDKESRVIELSLTEELPKAGDSSVVWFKNKFKEFIK